MKIKLAAAVLTGVLAAATNQYVPITVLVALAVIFDWITGIIGSKAAGESINSKKATIGFWKKIALFVALFFGFYLDYFIPYMLQKLSMELPVQALFSMIIGCYIVINECISICENLYKSNSSILPKWIVTMLGKTKTQLDKLGEDGGVEDNGNENK